MNRFVFIKDFTFKYGPFCLILIQGFPSVYLTLLTVLGYRFAVLRIISKEIKQRENGNFELTGIIYELGAQQVIIVTVR